MRVENKEEERRREEEEEEWNRRVVARCKNRYSLL